jgi:hypothetical protein
MACNLFDERDVRRTQRARLWRVLTAPERDCILKLSVPTDGTGAAQWDERKFRYFLVSAAALGQTTACPYLIRVAQGREAQ